MNIDTLVSHIRQYPDLHYRLSTEHITLFIWHARELKRDIDLMQPSRVSAETGPPATIPPSIVLFLSEALALPLLDVNALWSIFRNIIWESANEGTADSGAQVAQAVARNYEEYGYKYGIGASLQILLWFLLINIYGLFS